MQHRTGHSPVVLLGTLTLIVLISICLFPGCQVAPQEGDKFKSSLTEANYQTTVPQEKPVAERVLTDCTEPLNPVIRDKAISLVVDAPADLEVNSAPWKIWKIHYWVAKNISYVSDPKGQEYFAYAHETLETKGGDCDDFAILLSSLYEAVGLDAAIADIQTDNEGSKRHMACIVYWAGDSRSFLIEEKIVMEKIGVGDSAGPTFLRFWDVGTARPLLAKYASGIWIIADPTMAIDKDTVGHVTQKPYSATSFSDIGN